MDSTKKGNAKKTYIELAVAVLFYLIFSRIVPPQGLSPEGWKAILFMIVCVFVWCTEIVPIGISSCFLMFIPAFLGIQKTSNVRKLQ